MTLALGLHADYLFPKEAGRDYQPSRYLAAIDDLREQFTIISGSSHPGVSGGLGYRMLRDRLRLGGHGHVHGESSPMSARG